MTLSYQLHRLHAKYFCIVQIYSGYKVIDGDAVQVLSISINN